MKEFRRAASLPTDYGFPNRLEDVLILEAAQRINPADARSPYYLGNFWYAHRRYDEAIACWERASELDPSFATAQRNLGLAYFNKRRNPQLALRCFERAFALNSMDARVFFELDQLYKQLNHAPSDRLAVLQQQLDLVEVSPSAVPPVCRIMDYGKFKYQQSKKLQEARKKQVHVEVKEIKLRPKTDDHDLEFKVKHVRRFLEEGNKAKVTLVFRGREITHMDIGRAVIEKFAAALADIAVIESHPRVDGRQMFMIVAPKVKK